MLGVLSPRKEKKDGCNWVGKMTEKDLAKLTKANTDWLEWRDLATMFTQLCPCTSVCFPCTKRETECCYYPLFFSCTLFPEVPFRFLCFHYADYLNHVSLLYLLDQMHFCLSTGYSHINAPFIFWSRYCFSSPTSAIGLGKQNTYLLSHHRG